MAWRAVTKFHKTAPGTVLTIFLEPHVGGPAAALESGVDIGITYQDNSRDEAHVESASDTEAVIVMRDGSRWRMTPRSGPAAPGVPVAIPSTDWIIRSAA